MPLGRLIAQRSSYSYNGSTNNNKQKKKKNNNNDNNGSSNDKKNANSHKDPKVDVADARRSLLGCSVDLVSPIPYDPNTIAP